MGNKERKLVYGVGVNDAPYATQLNEIWKYKEDGSPVYRRKWVCPFFEKWKDMIKRCYDPRELNKRPSYRNVFVCDDWIHFMTFRAWMEAQDWEGKHLDKDLLFPGNKVYSPDACCFLEKRVNNFMTENTAKRGQYPVGTHLHKPTMKFLAHCGNVLTGKQEHIGLFNTPEEGHAAWLAYKLEQAKILAAEQSDVRIAQALINRYTNYVSN